METLSVLLAVALGGMMIGHELARRRYFRQEINIELKAAMEAQGMSVVNTLKYQAICQRLVSLERELGMRGYYEEH